MSKKGIDLTKISKKIVTNEQSVIQFFGKFPDKAFTIDMLKKEGFSTNIRKVLNRLLEKELINKTNIMPENEGRWVTAYFISSSLIEFIIKKMEGGWVLETIKINGDEISVEVYYYKEDNSFNLKFNSADFKDVIVYYSEQTEDEDNIPILRSIRYSEIEDLSSGTAINLEFLMEDQEEELDESFEIYSEKGIRKRISRSKSSITGNEIQQAFNDLNFDVDVDIEKRVISIRGSQWDEDEESENPVLIDSAGLGAWDADRYDYMFKNIEKVLLYY